MSVLPARTRAGLGAVLVTVLALTATMPAPAVAGARGIARSAFEATNDRRADHDLRRLRAHDCLEDQARRQARRMARQQRLFHQDMGRVLRVCDLRSVGENVAVGFDGGQAVVTAWMASPGHRANLLERSQRLMGIAAKRGEDGEWYVAQVLGRR